MLTPPPEIHPQQSTNTARSGFSQLVHGWGMLQSASYSPLASRISRPAINIRDVFFGASSTMGSQGLIDTHDRTASRFCGPVPSTDAHHPGADFSDVPTCCGRHDFSSGETRTSGIIVNQEGRLRVRVLPRPQRQSLVRSREPRARSRAISLPSSIPSLSPTSRLPPSRYEGISISDVPEETIACSGSDAAVDPNGSLASHTSKVQALVIGVNEYQFAHRHRAWNLRGAVGDADDVRNYLHHDLGVPDDQIVNLRDSAATCGAIKSEIKALGTRPGFSTGDPIFIYFAGHGRLITTAGTGKSIPSILPHDFAFDMHDKERLHRVISFAWLDKTLRSLAGSSGSGRSGIGDNITLVFDCCLNRSEGTVRMGLDEFWKGIEDGPYVVLHACSLGEYAREIAIEGPQHEGHSEEERERRGLFTGALLGVWIWEIATVDSNIRPFKGGMPTVSSSVPAPFQLQLQLLPAFPPPIVVRYGKARCRK
ncbi:unnamed protein product [Peniophora sp. CBMAI 1063]|nr:unnamed protein product [Peniophora sp. CBMAI 1063]